MPPRRVIGRGPQWTTVMGDGWEAVSSLTDIVRIGDVAIPTEVELRRESLDGIAPEIIVVFESRQSVPLCRSVEFRMIDGGREVRPQDLRGLDLPAMLERVVVEHSVRVTDVSDGHVRASLPHTESDYAAARATVRGARKGRTPRRITENLLRRVAETYLNPPPEAAGPRAAVEAAFGVSPRMAAEYIARCRSHDPPLLPPTAKPTKQSKGGRPDGKPRKKN